MYTFEKPIWIQIFTSLPNFLLNCLFKAPNKESGRVVIFPNSTLEARQRFLMFSIVETFI